MLQDICDVMKYCYEKNWITSRDGNLSIHCAKSEIMHITPSGLLKHDLLPTDMVRLDVSNREFRVPDGVRPSGELLMHWRLQKYNDDRRAVLHVHATHIVAAMYAGWDLREIAKQFPEVNRYTKVAQNVPALPAVSMALGDATYLSMVGADPTDSLREDDLDLECDIVGQERHGVCAVGKDPWEAFEHVERLDHVCEIVLKSGVRPT